MTSDKKKLIKRQMADWQKWSSYWKLLKAGSRPSQEDVKIIFDQISKHIKGIKNPNVVILGSTPEFREMCGIFSAVYGAEVVCVELVDYMYKAMTQLLLQKNEKESVIFCNWLEIKLPNNFADVVIGDLTEGNITAELLPKYYAEMNRVLKDDGKYIHRTTAYPNKEIAKPALKLKDVLKKLRAYEKKIFKGEMSVHEVANYFGAELAWDSWYKINNGCSLSISAYGEEIAEIDKLNDELSKLVMKAFHMIWDSAVAKTWDYYTLEKTNWDYQKFFKEVEYYYASSYPTAKYTPIFVMTKK
ncbi:MAG: hypothetical protein WCJ51_02135 [Candidatus Moraniibacteriota bacterium]